MGFVAAKGDLSISCDTQEELMIALAVLAGTVADGVLHTPVTGLDKLYDGPFEGTVTKIEDGKARRESYDDSP